MSEISPSIWHQDNQGEWKLYFNTELDMISSSSSHNQIQTKIKINKNISEMKLILGTLVMTPKGIGRLIKANEDIVFIKFNQDIKEENFPINSISNYFNCFILDYSNGNIDIIRIRLKASGKVDDIFVELEKLNKLDTKENNYMLIFNKDILKKEYTFEQINLFNNSKILLLIKNKVIYSVSRFVNTRQPWYLYNLEGICLSASKRIKLVGVGLYGSKDNKIIPVTLKILDGSSTMGNIIFEENVEIVPASNELGPITKIVFSKPVDCKQNQDYSIIIYSKINTNTFYGFNGKAYVEGEKGVGFSFKRLIGKSGGTGVETGNFPELYYYLN